MDRCKRTHKTLLQKGIKYLRSRDYRFLVHSMLGWHDAMGDEAFLRKKFRVVMGKDLQLTSPVTFNEKLQWLKLHDRRPEYTMMADKYAVRDYIAHKLGEEHLIPLLGVWDDPDDIDFETLPDQFVLKCNHNSGLGMCICKDKSALDVKKVRKELRKGLRQDYYLTGREWPYKNIPRKILCEKYMTDMGRELVDFKVHNFNGEPKLILVCQDRFSQTGLTEDFFTPQWEHLPMKRPGIPNASQPIPKPEQLERMLELARQLSKGIPFVRTDFYVIEGQIYFGEFTFSPASGLTPFEPKDWDETLGSWLALPNEICKEESVPVSEKGLHSFCRRLIKAIKNPSLVAIYLLGTKAARVLPDEAYLKVAYRLKAKKTLRLDAPLNFNEKLQWLKLHNRRPEFTVMVDKYLVREYIAEKLGPEYLIPSLGVWDDPDQIDFDKLPDQFVLKCNHNSGLGMYICKDRSKLDTESVKKDLRRGLKQDYYWNGREWPYKHVPKKIIAEKYMVDESGTELKDYKVFCFNGEPKLIQVDFGRFVKHKRNIYSVDWELLDMEIEYPRDADVVIQRPAQLEKLLELARTLAQGIPHLRTDFYVIGDDIYFGELTFFHGSGYEHFTPEIWNDRLGSWISLPADSTD